jgi:hypothetical protein
MDTFTTLLPKGPLATYVFGQEKFFSFKFPHRQLVRARAAKAELHFTRSLKEMMARKFAREKKLERMRAFYYFWGQ